MKVMKVMKMTHQFFITIQVFLLCVLLDQVSSNLIYGKEAEQLCREYKKTCPRGKVCAVQTMVWPTTMRFPVCTHQRAEPTRSRACTQAPSPGGCGGQLRRWHYNVHMGACAWFTYGGCGGNLNNFLSREECEHACIRSHDHIHPASTIFPATTTTATTTTTTASAALYIEDIEGNGLMVKTLPEGRKYVGQERSANMRKSELAVSGRHGDEGDSGNRGADDVAAGSPPQWLSQASRGHGQNAQRLLVQYVPHRLNALEMRYGRPDEVRTSFNGRYHGGKSHLSGRGHQTPSQVTGHHATVAPSPPAIFVKDSVKLVPHPAKVAPQSLEPLTHVRVPNVMPRPEGASDVTSGRQLEPFRSSYAAGAVESVRHLPFSSESSGRWETAEGAGNADGQRRHRDRTKKQRRGRRNRQGKKRKPATTQHSPAPRHENERLEVRASDLVHRSPPTVSLGQGRPERVGEGVSAHARLAEFRSRQTEYRPGLNDRREMTSDGISSRDRSHASPDGDHKREKTRRTKGRKKGGKKGENKADTEDDWKEVDNTYYGSMKLFKLLERLDSPAGSSYP